MKTKHVSFSNRLLTYLFLSFIFMMAMPQSHAAKSNKGYRLSIRVEGYHDSIMYLGNYYAGKTYVIDTAYINRKGEFLFERKDRRLMPGMYFFINQEQNNYVEFIIYHETPDFSFFTRESGWARYMEVKGSKENEYLFSFQKANRRIYDEIDSLQRTTNDEEAKKAIRQGKMHELDSIKEDMIAKHPNSMLALIMNATREPAVPTTDSTGRTLSDRERWEYYMEHYFDYVRLDDDAIVRTPDMIFHQRVMNYLDRNLKNASAEIVCKYADMLIEKSRPSKETFKYLVHTITEKYLQSNVMSYDAVYVHLVQKYIASGDAFWMSPSSVDDNVKRAATWEKLLIGKVAPDLIMRDDQQQIHQLSRQNHKYTLLIFWSPTCGHCKTMIPELYNSYAALREKYDIGAFAILSEPDDNTRPKWRQFISQHHLDWLNLDGGEANIDWHEVYAIETTPQIYLLDNEKHILAKHLNAETFEMVVKTIEGDK